MNQRFITHNILQKHSDVKTQLSRLCENSRLAQKPISEIGFFAHHRSTMHSSHVAHTQGSSVKTAGNSAVCSKGEDQVDDVADVLLVMKLIRILIQRQILNF